MPMGASRPRAWRTERRLSYEPRIASAQIAGEVVGRRDELGSFVIQHGADHAEAVHRKVRAQVQATELLRPPQLGELLRFPANQDEAPQITAMGLQDGDLDRVDLAGRLALVPVRHRLAEDLARLHLPPTRRIAESKEEPEVRHVTHPSCGFL